MRISDWSSDVCSSDLKIDLGFFVEPGLAPVALARDRAGRIDEAPGDSAVFVDDGRKADMARDRFFGAFRPEERRVGRVYVSKRRYRWAPDHYTNNKLYGKDNSNPYKRVYNTI